MIITYNYLCLKAQRDAFQAYQLQKKRIKMKLGSEVAVNTDIKRIGAEGGTGTGGQHLPFSKATQVDGWLYVSGQTPMTDGEIVEGSVIEQSRLAIQNCLDIMDLAEYTLADVVHVKVFLTDSRYFQSFNKVFKEVFGDHPPARVCAVTDLVVDCKVEVDVTCFNASKR
jgi:enamine deaminase RidA (YjgF/YER057c/UK114 family)